MLSQLFILPNTWLPGDVFLVWYRIFADVFFSSFPIAWWSYSTFLVCADLQWLVIGCRKIQPRCWGCTFIGQFERIQLFVIIWGSNGMICFHFWTFEPSYQCSFYLYRLRTFFQMFPRIRSPFKISACLLSNTIERDGTCGACVKCDCFVNFKKPARQHYIKISTIKKQAYSSENVQRLSGWPQVCCWKRPYWLH